ATTLPAAYRVWLGGSDAWASVLSVGAAAAAGSLAHVWAPRDGGVGPRHALALSVVVFLTTFASFALLDPGGLVLFGRAWLPLLAISVVGIGLVGRLFHDVVKHAEAVDAHARFHHHRRGVRRDPHRRPQYAHDPRREPPGLRDLGLRAGGADRTRRAHLLARRARLPRAPGGDDRRGPGPRVRPRLLHPLPPRKRRADPGGLDPSDRQPPRAPVRDRDLPRVGGARGGRDGAAGGRRPARRRAPGERRGARDQQPPHRRRRLAGALVAPRRRRQPGAPLARPGERRGPTHP